MHDLSEIPEDYLGKASDAKRSARVAIKDNRLDDAWRLLQDQQRHWINHANAFRFTKAQTLSLLSSIHEDMANILRIEKRHDAALSHILYCVTSNSRPTQSQKKKLNSYFRRCKFDSVSERDVTSAARKLGADPDFQAAQQVVADWRAKE